MSGVRAIAEIPPLAAEARPANRRLVDRPRPRLWQSVDRRTFIKSAVAAGIGAGMAFTGLFPPSRRAKAHHGEDYKIQATCAGVAYNEFPGGGCGRQCGPSVQDPNSCKENVDAHYWGYHKENNSYYLRENQCNDGGYDGWKWRVESDCNIAGCNNWSRYRCHDGWREEIGPDTKTVCSWFCECGGGDYHWCGPDD